MEVQQLVWQCGEAARERGLGGQASQAFVQRCVDNGGRVGPIARNPPTRPSVAQRTTSAWKLMVPSSAQVSLSLVSTNQQYVWTFTCTAGGRPPNSFVFDTFFTMPTSVYLREPAELLIDNAKVPVEVSGSEGGVALSDATEFGIGTLSPRVRQMLAEGSTLRVRVRSRSGPRPDATFNLAGGEAAFADFQQRCRAIR